jgi:hypothetical protein
MMSMKPINQDEVTNTSLSASGSSRGTIFANCCHYRGAGRPNDLIHYA